MHLVTKLGIHLLEGHHDVLPGGDIPVEKGGVLAKIELGSGGQVGELRWEFIQDDLHIRDAKALEKFRRELEANSAEGSAAEILINLKTESGAQALVNLLARYAKVGKGRNAFDAKGANFIEVFRLQQRQLVTELPNNCTKYRGINKGYRILMTLDMHNDGWLQGRSQAVV